MIPILWPPHVTLRYLDPRAEGFKKQVCDMDGARVEHPEDFQEHFTVREIMKLEANETSPFTSLGHFSQLLLRD